MVIVHNYGYEIDPRVLNNVLMIKSNSMPCCISRSSTYSIIFDHHTCVEIITYCYVTTTTIDFVMSNFGLLIKNRRLGGCTLVWVY